MIDVRTENNDPMTDFTEVISNRKYSMKSDVKNINVNNDCARQKLFIINLHTFYLRYRSQ